jgi:hypothetical protein
MRQVISYLVRSELRRRWRATLLLACLTALVVGTVLAAVAGAHRSRTAFDRYLAAARAPDVGVVGDPGTVKAAATSPLVTDAVTTTLVAMFPEDADPTQFFPMFAPDSDAIGTTMFVLPVVDGRRANPTQPLEVNLGERTARRLHVAVGDEVAMATFARDQGQAMDGPSGDSEPRGPRLELEVVGIVRDPGDLGGRETDITVIFLTPAFTREIAPELASLAHAAFLRLRDPQAVTALTTSIQAAGDAEVDTSFGGEAFRSQADPTMAAVATGLRAFALAAALAGAVAIAQVTARSTQRAAAERDALAAVGVGAMSRRLALAAPSALALLGGSIAGAGVAMTASPLLPIGLARRADPDPGFHADWGVLGLGSVIAVTAGLALALASATIADRRARRRAHFQARQGLAGALVAAGAPVVISSGASLALSPGRGARAVPVRAALIGVTAAVAGVLGAVSFVASSDHLRGSPALYGWPWDIQVSGTETTGLDAATNAALLERAAVDPDVAAAGLVWFQLPAAINGHPSQAMEIEDHKGHTPALVVEGRAAEQAGEIAVGGATLELLNRRVGDSVEARLLGRPARRVRIVGVVAFPVDADGGSSAQGIALTRASARFLGFDGTCPDTFDCNQNVVITFARGADVHAAGARYDSAVTDLATALTPGELDSLLAVEQLPIVLAVFLATIGVIAITFTVATTVRRRRVDLALLRTLGMTSRDLRRVVFVQTSILVGTGAIAGALLGAVTGRQVWRLTVDAVHVAYVPVVPLAAIVLVPVATFVIAHVAATFPRRRAASLRPAAVLRSE